MQDFNTDAILSVSELNHSVRNLLESEFMHVLVEGEISNFVCPASGHWYFSLKDNKAQIRCAMFRGANMRVGFTPEDGSHVQVTGKVSLYAPRGDYQLIVSHLEEVGDGALRRAFEQLKQLLAKEGLFKEEFKQELPEIPRAIGVVTSSTGAAVRDIIKVLKRRCPSIPIIVYPTLVQGTDAAASIAKMIEVANERQECDVLIVGRGGGSLEDLWAFNEEIVARAIFASHIPVVSAVGHEIDITIADFVADVRAPTPSAAAEMVSPNSDVFYSELLNLNQRLKRELIYLLQQKQQHLQWLRKRLRHPGQIVQEQMQQLDYNWQSLSKAMQFMLHKKQQQLSLLSRTLNTVSPLATLDRGYAIVQKGKKVVTTVKQLNKDDVVVTRVADGEFKSKVL